MAVSRPTRAGRDAAANERETAMAEEAARSRLGRGLAALIGDVGEETAAVERARGQRRVPVEFLRPNPRNPRQSYSEVELDELAASIRERGIIQPIVARTLRGSADHYEIIAGERRSSLRSSRTCSARTSTRSKRRWAIRRSKNSGTTRTTSRG